MRAFSCCGTILAFVLRLLLYLNLSVESRLMIYITSTLPFKPMLAICRIYRPPWFPSISSANREMLSKAPVADARERLLTSLCVQAAVDVMSSNGWLSPALAAMEMSQMVRRLCRFALVSRLLYQKLRIIVTVPRVPS